MRKLALLLLPSLAVLAGCTTLPNGRRWGEDAIAPFPSLDRVAKSAVRAIMDPMTWIPAAGAVAMAFNGNDRKVSDWAIERTPVFRSQSNARTASDLLLAAGFVETFGTTLATPSGSDPELWALSKFRGLAIEAGAIGSVSTVTGAIKLGVARKRPTGSGQDGFPSGHSAAAFSCATLSSKNLDSIDLPGPLRFGLQIGTYTMAGATAWARVEGGKHFPSDVLASIAISHLLTSFAHDAFMGLDVPDVFGMEVELSRTRVGLVLRFSF